MTTPQAQLEVAAAHWLREAAIQLSGRLDASQFARVADECERVAGVKKQRGPAHALHKDDGELDEYGGN